MASARGDDVAALAVLTSPPPPLLPSPPRRLLASVRAWAVAVTVALAALGIVVDLRLGHLVQLPGTSSSSAAATTKRVPRKQQQHYPPATIVCQFSGEMGNNLGKYAHCHVVSELLWQRYRLDTEIVIRHQDSPKWVHAARDLQNCIPFFRSLDFSGANSREFDEKRQEQISLLGKNVSDVLLKGLDASTGHNPPEELDDALRTFANLVEASRRGDPPFPNATLRALSNDIDPSNSATTATRSTPPDVRVPFLFVAWMSSIETYVDTFMDDFRQLFALESSVVEGWTNRTSTKGTCCGILPDPDETVFHLRNFFVEMPRIGPAWGYNEATPRQLSDVLLGHLKRGDKVAILSRFPQATAQPYVDALEQRGLQVRFISGQTGTQDFCFLVHARREMIGVAISTYFLWAAYLSNCTKVVAYSIDSENRREHFGDAYWQYKFTHPTLKDRITLPLLPHVVDPTPAPTAAPTAATSVNESNRATNSSRRWRRP